MIHETARPARKGAPKPADKGTPAPAAKGQPKPKKAAAKPAAAPAVTPAPVVPKTLTPAITPATTLMVEKAVHSLGFAVEDLRALASSDNPLLGDIALRELEVAVGLTARMQRVLCLLQPEDGQGC